MRRLKRLQSVSTSQVQPYTTLALVYDEVMRYVDYSMWVDHIDAICDAHGFCPHSVLELGCGTGTFAIEYVKRHDVRYLGTDGQREMIEVACSKVTGDSSGLEFDQMDFLEIDTNDRFDCVLLLFDGLNYLLDQSNLQLLFDGVSNVLVPGGLLIFDQSTPANSENNRDYFEDAGQHSIYSFVRKSAYDCETRIHTTEFELGHGDRRYVEEHRQRAYTMSEIKAILETSSFKAVGSYADFTLRPADDLAERIHWVVVNR